MIPTRALVLILSITFCVVGCRSNKRAPMPEQNSQAAAAEPQRPEDLPDMARALADVAKQLPGRDAKADRQLVADAFDRAASALAVLAGPEPSGALRQQLYIVDSSRATLKNDNVSAEPATDSGLRALQNALFTSRDRLFPHDDKLSKQLGELRDRVDELDSVHGPLHSLTVAQCFAAASDAISTMAKEVTSLSAAMQPAATPAAKPVQAAPK
jgi:hypothetical protein